jgi:hypothetical protein
MKRFSGSTVQRFTVAVMLTALALASGCASQDSGEWANVPKYFYQQPRTDHIKIKGFKKIVVEGDDCEIILPIQLEPLSMVPRDPGTLATIGTLAKDTVLTGLGIYEAGSVIKKLSERPQVIETTKEVLVPVEGAK